MIYIGIISNPEKLKYKSRGGDFWSWLRMTFLCGVVAMSSNKLFNCGAGGQWQLCRY